jgi:hypothetical protein
VASLRGPPLALDVLVPVTAAMVEARLEAPLAASPERLAVDPLVARFGIRVVTTLRFMLAGHPERAFQFTGDPGRVVLDPRWHQAAWRFVRLGFEHILDGVDHLLFIVCLVLPLRRFWPLVGVVTSFTVAHSITLAASALGHAPDALWFPPLVETLIAASILYMAIENVVGFARASGRAPGNRPFTRRWIIAFAFGLVHGFGFSFALEETLQLAGDHLALSLAAFNVGVELGQVLVLLVLVPMLALFLRRVIEEWLGGVILSVLIGHTAWHWMTARGATLGEYDWSLSDPAALASSMRWVMVVVAVWFAVWAARVWRRGRASSRD